MFKEYAKRVFRIKKCVLILLAQTCVFFSKEATSLILSSSYMSCVIIEQAVVVVKEFFFDKGQLAFVEAFVYSIWS